jgi:arylsulfatase
MASRPNIILIFPDQHRGDVMGCAGNPAAQTPNLDRLASEGVQFPGCCTNSPLCMPARASLISGQYVNQHGIWHNWNAADRHGPSHVRNMRDSGYHTAVIGKTHLYVHGGPDVKDTRDHVQQLYDWGYVDTHELTGPWASRRIDSPYTDYLAEKGLLDAHRDYIGDYLRGMWSGEVRPWEEPPPPLSPEDHLDTYTGRTSADWVRNYTSDKPFYLQVCFPGPHDPFDSPREYRAMYRPEDIPVGVMDKPTWPVSSQLDTVLRWSALDGMTEAQKQIMGTFYYAKVTLIDHAIGLILKALEEKGMLDNTWIIYTSDHGEMLGDHFMSHKIVFYESALKIPCIIRPPGGGKGRESNALTDQLDVAATILDIGGAKPFEQSDGHSLVQNVMAAPDTPDAHKGKEAVFSEVNLYSMVLTDRYKMAVNSLTREPLELYDMMDDPNELNNLVRDPAFKKVRDELTERHISYLLGHLDEARLKVFQDIETERQSRGERRA